MHVGEILDPGRFESDKSGGQRAQTIEKKPTNNGIKKMTDHLLPS